MTRVVSRSPDDTEAAGRAFALRLKPGDVVALEGPLGSGKTKFTAGVCAGLGVEGHATSPTFTLINEYPAPFGIVAHVDLYRIAGKREIAELGLEEYFSDRCICLIEWPEMVREILPPGAYTVRLAHGGSASEREIRIEEPAEALR
ncbi:MAG TPA: tRNA (adenosine(37)-N6)-threonylcarbamoyltransferase complex ATPase subunit type 1 TsaE [Bacteroidota bacterium]|nr:tRNA (adenosine(37)-N6)-threonylcarbamoyltransferase complex ATPase subunit type 1 TsaE [Bacteroidota bacterium]